MEHITLQPQHPPPILDRFCHLSADAQKVMAAIYKQYQQQKERILLSQMDRQQPSQGPSRYYQSFYKAKFGSCPAPQESSQSSINQEWERTRGSNVSSCSNERQNSDLKVDNIRPPPNHSFNSRTLYNNKTTCSTSNQFKDASLNFSEKMESSSVLTQRDIDDIMNETGAASNSQTSDPLSLSPLLFPSLEGDSAEQEGDTTVISADVHRDQCDENPIIQSPNIITSPRGPLNVETLCKRKIGIESKIDRVAKTSSKICIHSKDIGEAKPNDFDNTCFKKPYAVGPSFNLTIGRMEPIPKIINDVQQTPGQDSPSNLFVPPSTEIGFGNLESPCSFDEQSTSIKASSRESTMDSISKRLKEHQQVRKSMTENGKITPIQSTSVCKSSEQTNKRKIPSFFAPYKKPKVPDEGDLKENTSIKNDTDIVNLTSLDSKDQSDLLQRIADSQEILIALVYNDSTNQLREHQTKKKQQNQKPKTVDEVSSIVIGLPGKDLDGKPLLKLYKASSDVDECHLEWIRKFWDSVLKSSSRKICYGAKELFMVLYKSVFPDCKVKIEDWMVLDPQIAGWLLDPDNPVSVFEESLKSVNLDFEKKEVLDCSELLKGDLLLLGTLMSRLYQKLKSRELWELFCCVETKLVPLLAFMECQQVQIDTDKLVMFSNTLKKKLQKLEQKAFECVGHSFLINSPAQLRQVLFEELKLDAKLPQKKKLSKTSVGHQISTSESVLQQLVDIHPLPSIVLEYRQFQKLKSTYMDGIMSCVQNGSLSTHWDQISAATGRLSSYQPNVQAIPKAPITITHYKDNFIVGKEDDDTLEVFARDIFRSLNSWSFIAADFQQIELRLLAHLADDDVLLQIFRKQSEADIFEELTSQWLGKPASNVTSSEREQTKRIVYSVMYGAGKEKLAEYLKISANDAKAIMNSFLVKFPAVNQFSKKCVEFCQKNGFTTTIFRRKRMIPNIKNQSPPLRAQAERQAVNFCVQGSAADLCKAAMLQIEQALRNQHHLRARQLFQIHDEILLEVHDDDVKAVTSILKTIMEDSKTLCGSVVKLKVPIKVSISTGKTWGHMNPVQTN